MPRPSQPNGHEVWTLGRLRRCLEGCCNGDRVVVLANREPFRHDRGLDGKPLTKRSASGVVTALEPVVEACRGVWVAHGSGTADRDVVEWRDGLNVPSNNPKYRLRRVWLDEQEEQGYYYGFANEALWPLCHCVPETPIFREADFTTYRHVNEKFAAAACEEADGVSPVVLVQDYHFALAPRMLRDRLPLSTIVTFWHVPWPTPSRFGTCPWRRNLLCGLLGSAIIGFHTDCDRQQFLHTVERFLDADVDHERGTVTYAGHTTAVRTYPISIEWPNRFTLRSSEGRTCRDSVLRRLGLPADARLVVGVDRLDYTKGICEKVLAIERLFESYPEFRGRVRFVQIAEPSRECLPAYRELRSRVLATIDRVNTRFGSLGYQPIVLRQMHHEPAEVFEFLRSADVCYVGSLHDGMNLVAKEFVAARDDYRGVLVLSVFAGAAQQLSGALMVNPFVIDDASHILAQALRMAASEQATRMRAMRSIVAESNSYWWAGRMLQDAARIRKAQGLLSATRPAVMQKIPA